MVDGDEIPLQKWGKSRGLFIIISMNKALMKHINDSEDNNYIIFVPTTNISIDFYIEFNKMEDSAMFCISNGIFKDIKLAFDTNSPVI